MPDYVDKDKTKITKIFSSKYYIFSPPLKSRKPPVNKNLGWLVFLCNARMKIMRLAGGEIILTKAVIFGVINKKCRFVFPKSSPLLFLNQLSADNLFDITGSLRI